MKVFLRLFFPVMYLMVGCLLIFGLYQPFIKSPLIEELKVVDVDIAIIEQSEQQVLSIVFKDESEISICNKIWIDQALIIALLDSKTENTSKASVKILLTEDLKNQQCLTVYSLRVGNNQVFTLEEVNLVIENIAIGFKILGVGLMFVGFFEMRKHFKSGAIAGKVRDNFDEKDY